MKNEMNNLKNETYILRAKAGILQPEPKEIQRGSLAFLESFVALSRISWRKVEIVKAD